MLLAEIDREFLRAAPLRVPSRLIAQALFEGRPPMTRGAKLDAVTRSHLRLVASRWPRQDVDRPIFIVGIGRSGTTLLGRIIASGKGVGYLKEPKALWHVGVPDEDISGFYADEGRFVLDATDVTDAVRDRVSTMYNWFATLTRSSRIVDKYPEMTYRVPFLRALYPDAKIIAIVRDPVAVVSSIVNYSEAMADGRGNWWGVDDRKWVQMAEQLISDSDILSLADDVGPGTGEPAARARAEWVLGATHLLRSQEQIDLIIRFEELLSTPRETLETLCEVCELDPDPIVEYGCKIVGSPKTETDSSVQRGEFSGLLADLGYQVAHK
ncbi:MAG: hypothetical protein ACI81L_000452 [Verrucomicrobiales bacterium]|jgi:hypothetical protein